MKKKVLVVFGTRPEAIKMAPLVKELLKNSEKINTITCVTAQHRGMLDQVLEIFKIKPDYDLDIMKIGQTLSDITASVLMGIEKVILKEKPDLILVHGDTTTATAAAIAGFYNKIKVGHVEAGLRTYDKYSPFPEELNRQIIDNIADLMFAPTEMSANNITQMKLNKNQKVFITGNTAIDAMKYTVNNNYNHEIFDWVGNDRMILLTAHRRENLGEPMKNFFKALVKAVEEIKDIKVVYPIHMNPIVREIAKEILGDNEKIKLIEPLSVVDFHNFMKKAYLILSDSGGIQEEAPSLGKPVLVLRDTTERPEGIKAGTLKLVGTDEMNVYKEIIKLLTDKDEYKKMAQAKNPYGDGTSSEQIVKIILENN